MAFKKGEKAEEKKEQKKKPAKAMPGKAAGDNRANLKLGEPFQSKGSLPTMRPC